VYTLKQNGLSHCDLHGKNVFIRCIGAKGAVPNADKPVHEVGKHAWSFIEFEDKLFTIGVIDAGEGADGGRFCPKARKVSRQLIKDGSKCGAVKGNAASEYRRLIAGETRKYHTVDNDFAFLYHMLYNM
jgi:hypothetical protein